ncbi:MAG TPA: glycoside hydrolase family 97 catalytic domain-containing protein, partial [Pedobacter sp.]
GSMVWSQNDIGGYEGKYLKQEIAELKEGQKAGPPLTIALPDRLGFAAITEAGLTDFAGMSLIAGGNRSYKAYLTGNTLKTGKVITPWRVIEVGKDLNTLVNCDIIANVSPKPDATLFPKGFVTDWIKPGMSVWSWLAGNGDVTFENMKKFSVWAGQLGIPYNLVDEGWSGWKDEGKDKWQLIRELVDYSAQQKVKIWVWKAYPDHNGIAGLKDPAERQRFFKQCRDAGVAGVKIDFFDEESQQVIDFYQAALKDAAKMHLMLDFHGANKPTGESRTWPNEMSREGIRGLENTTSWPAHNTTLPFTRYLAGHADYTPLSFGPLVKGTTVTHQVATVAAFTSEFMCLAVNPEELISHPAKDFILSIPVVWDETVILPQSEIGEIAVIARRSGKTWFLAVLNGEQQRSVKINLSFLGKGIYNSVTMEDDPADPKKFLLKKTQAVHTQALDINLAEGGGYISRFTLK